MRILRVAPWLYPDTTGGGQYHVHALSRDQAAMGHDVTVVTVRADPELAHVEERDGYTVIRYDAVASPLGNDVSPGLAQYLATASGFDVVHAHSHYYLSTNLAALKRWGGGVPLAITNHGLYSQSAPEDLFRLYLRTVGRWTFDQADVVFNYTAADRERVRALGVTSRLEVIPNGIDTGVFRPDGAASELVDADGPVVLFVGRFAAGKRPWLAIEAFAAVLETYPDAELYLCGEGPLREELEATVRDHDLEESVTFLGFVPYEEMPRVYRSGDVLVLPSRAEGTPRTIMEALSSGVPVVSSPLEEVQSAFGASVRYVECADVGAFGSAIVDELATDRQVGLDERFRWERTVDETTAELEAIAGEM